MAVVLIRHIELKHSLTGEDTRAFNLNVLPGLVSFDYVGMCGLQQGWL